VCVHSRLGLIILSVAELEVILMHSLKIIIILMNRRLTTHDPSSSMIRTLSSRLRLTQFKEDRCLQTSVEFNTALL
jgi:hypothetical protein